MLSMVWYKIRYQHPNYNSATVKVWEWMSNFTPHFIVGEITYLCWDKS